MKLTIKDRVLILSSVLPNFDTRKGMIIKKSISEKICLSNDESNQVISNQLGNGQIDIGFKTAAAITDTKEYDFVDEELLYMKQRVDHIDKNGMFSVESMDTYNQVLDAPFENEEYILKWNEYMGILPKVIEQPKEETEVEQ